MSLGIFSEEEVLEFFVYLDALRRSGVTNMMGAAPYLVEKFGLSKHHSQEILTLWQKTFDQKIKVDRRARVVYMANGGTAE